MDGQVYVRGMDVQRMQEWAGRLRGMAADLDGAAGGSAVSQELIAGGVYRALRIMADEMERAVPTYSCIA